MLHDKINVWKSDTARQLAVALATIDSAAEMQNFLRDVMTVKEITEISSRLEAAHMLTDGERYADIVAKTRLSSRTVARISDWLQNGCKGYETALSAIHHDHILPVSAE
jgi:TrpR-related protein YerC/YecD